jgi:hypothetical protein
MTARWDVSRRAVLLSRRLLRNPVDRRIKAPLRGGGNFARRGYTLSGANPLLWRENKLDLVE